MKFEILDDNGNVINTIVADQQFVNDNHLNRYRELPEPSQPSVEPVKTDEEKLADVAAALVAKLIADGVLKQA